MSGGVTVRVINGRDYTLDRYTKLEIKQKISTIRLYMCNVYIGFTLFVFWCKKRVRREDVGYRFYVKRKRSSISFFYT